MLNRSIKVKGSQFVDQEGRQVILHGINMVCKEGNYIGAWDEKDFRKLKEWGFNVIRLGIIWDGVEPEPGKYDDEYLSAIEKFVEYAANQGLWVFLDMHQDLYGVDYGDGAPQWATLSDGAPHVTGEVWSDAYLISPAVQRAFDHFWNNAPAEDGIGLQDHYAAAWRHVAERFADHPAVIGYDLMNEPFIGSDANQIQPLMYAKYAEEFAVAEEISDPDIEQLMQDFFDPEKRMNLLQFMSETERYTSIIDVVTEGYARFERDTLSSFFSKVTQAIREVDSETAIFLETNYFSNIGVLSGIEPAIDVHGNRDANQVYAPHGYDLVTDTNFSDAANAERVGLIFERHEQTRGRLDMPLVIGEWGAYYGSSGATEAAYVVKDMFEKLLCGDTYWSYEGSNMDEYTFFKAIRRAYPMAVAGCLQHYRHDPDSDAFTMTWEEANTSSAEGVSLAATIIYVPDLQKAENGGVALSPQGDSFHLERIEGTNAGYVVISPSTRLGESIVRSIRIGS
ncbi:cellulase family glycosylhydrolase [Paenibacillus guangzhouensis]|uniref:cellulase family glycosylhydrolase n=1 Tax=Paenibacillus guangzhouensis TaxID=1473112 RepID=UPI001266D706|nr:cellulase family glycosylhydrolase [Paenibacillus guangzhouensis]